MPQISQVVSPAKTLEKTLSCIANGSGVLTYKWFINGTFLTNSDVVTVKNEGGGVSVAQCVVTNGVLTMKQKFSIYFECMLL